MRFYTSPYGFINYAGRWCMVALIPSWLALCNADHICPHCSLWTLNIVVDRTGQCIFVQLSKVAFNPKFIIIISDLIWVVLGFHLSPKRRFITMRTTIWLYILMVWEILNDFGIKEMGEFFYQQNMSKCFFNLTIAEWGLFWHRIT